MADRRAGADQGRSVSLDGDLALSRRRRALVALVAVIAAGTAVAQTPVDRLLPIIELTRDDVPQPPVRPKYPDTAGIDIVTDAPWRVVKRADGGWIPLLLFVPDADLAPTGFLGNNAFRGLRFKRITVYENGRVVYEDTDTADPTVGGRLVVVDENGTPTTANLAGGPDRCERAAVACDVPKPGGWHRILRLPLAATSGRDIVYLKTEIVAEPVYDRPTETRRYPFSRTLRVIVTDEPFPSLGPQWKYYDAHMHTIVEWSLGHELLAPRKAFGGPIQMIRESAWVMGLTPSLAELKNHVIATDHNAFFSDDYAIGVGPTSRGRPGMVRRPDIFARERGQIEFEVMRELLGQTFGEEITLATKLLADRVNYGSHLLLLRGDHFDGPWHGGDVWFRMFGRRSGGDPNPNSLSAVLTSIRTSAETFAYAAHPFAVGNHWNQGDGSERYLETFHDSSRRYTTTAGKFVLKGAQYWNEKNELELAVEAGPATNRVTAVDLFDLHPFADAPSTRQREPDFEIKAAYPRFATNPAWDKDLHLGLIDWHERIRRLLLFSFDDRPDERFPRKLYLIGGSDAHGDFNYSTSLLSTILDLELLRRVGVSLRSVTSNAFARVRTYVNGAGKPGADHAERALNALADGNAIVTDGPVVTMELDGELRFDGAHHRWREQSPPRRDAAGRTPEGFDPDGRIGGNGRFDGGFTALVPRGGRAGLRYRWVNSSEFGRVFGGAPDDLQLYVVSQDKPVERRRERRTAGSITTEIETVLPARTLPIDRNSRDRDVLVPLEVGLGETPVAIALGMRAVKSPTESYQAYTNPIWIVPVEAVSAAQPVNGRTAPGTLTVTFIFGASMSGTATEAFLRPLDADGNSAAGPALPLRPDASFGPDGWSAAMRGNRRIANGSYRVTNSTEISLPSTTLPGRFLVVLVDPHDIHGNRLNTVGTIVTVTTP